MYFYCLLRSEYVQIFGGFKLFFSCTPTSVFNTLIGRFFLLSGLVLGLLLRPLCNSGYGV
jgi:hypothetical protein